MEEEEYQIVKDKIGLDNYDSAGITDLISGKVVNDVEKRLKEEIIYQLESLRNHCAYMSKINYRWKKDIEALDFAIECIKNQEAEKGNWIPVSERLPEESGFYIVTRSFEDCYFPEIYMRCFSHADGDFLTIDGEEVTAWMPLPEPYKAESEVKE